MPVKFVFDISLSLFWAWRFLFYCAPVKCLPIKYREIERRMVSVCGLRMKRSKENEREKLFSNATVSKEATRFDFSSFSMSNDASRQTAIYERSKRWRIFGFDSAEYISVGNDICTRTLDSVTLNWYWFCHLLWNQPFHLIKMRFVVQIRKTYMKKDRVESAFTIRLYLCVD